MLKLIMVSVEETLIKASILFYLLILSSCSYLTTVKHINENSMANDSIANGKIKATAFKRFQNQEVCFDIELTGEDVKVEQVMASNWNLAWVDSTDHYHLMPTTQRAPGSIPKAIKVTSIFNTHTEYRNSFTNCVPSASLEEVKGIVMTARDLSSAKQNEMNLNWSNE